MYNIVLLYVHFYADALVVDFRFPNHYSTALPSTHELLFLCSSVLLIWIIVQLSQFSYLYSNSHSFVEIQYSVKAALLNDVHQLLGAVADWVKTQDSRSRNSSSYPTLPLAMFLVYPNRMAV